MSGFRAGAGALLAALALAACTVAVDGGFLGRSLPDGAQRSRTILIIYNHGFSSETAGAYRPTLPPILETARVRNPDVVVFSQLRNSNRLEAVDHAQYIAAAVETFRRDGVPIEHMILAGQSCGGWGSLQAAAFLYPRIGGVLAFAPTCHGRLPHPAEITIRRATEIHELADRVRAPGVIFLYEGDSYYDVTEWDGFETGRPGELRVERLSRGMVLQLCSQCARDSHGVVWDTKFVPAYFETRVQPLIDRVRERMRLGSAARR
ncbi:MAG: hypothetical protein HY294_03685 [Candidatus Rokubacteria bacterium]|nr:hypothetical protein [Candidatus Rokubacteria bacterium]MBI3825077.1 hypothetical protein [Candidatus Rokubacteria bacterium]